MAWQAGAAEVVITPPVGGEMDGYGARKSGSTGVHDDLLAHALVLDDGERRAAIVTCDVLFVDAPTVASVRATAARRWCIPPERVLVAATHTHQGPKGLTGFRSTADTELLAILARQIVGAIDVATRRLAPARLMAGSGRVDSVSLNRRFEERPVDTALRVLRVEGEDGALRAALLNFACHPTVLNHHNLLLSQDWPGFACRAVKALWGDVPVLFANGACGDVNPVKIGETFEDARRAGTIVGAEAARVLGELAAHGKPQIVHNSRRGDHSPKPPRPGRPAGGPPGRGDRPGDPADQGVPIGRGLPAAPRALTGGAGRPRPGGGGARAMARAGPAGRRPAHRGGDRPLGAQRPPAPRSRRPPAERRGRLLLAYCSTTAFSLSSMSCQNAVECSRASSSGLLSWVRVTAVVPLCPLGDRTTVTVW